VADAAHQIALARSHLRNLLHDVVGDQSGDDIVELADVIHDAEAL